MGVEDWASRFPLLLLLVYRNAAHLLNHIKPMEDNSFPQLNCHLHLNCGGQERSLHVVSTGIMAETRRLNVLRLTF